MGRHPDLERRAKLLDEVVGYLGRNGVAGVSLRPVARALGVSVNALVHHFGSKDELVRAYLLGRHERRQARLTARIADYVGPRAKILGIFDYLADSYRQPSFRGCPFVNANAEIQGDKVIVWSSDVPKPVGVRFGWANFPLVNLWNGAGLPASPFRTDNFPLSTKPK